MSTSSRPTIIGQLNVHSLGLKSRTGRVNDVAWEALADGETGFHRGGIDPGDALDFAAPAWVWESDGSRPSRVRR